MAYIDTEGSVQDLTPGTEVYLLTGDMVEAVYGEYLGTGAKGLLRFAVYNVPREELVGFDSVRPSRYGFVYRIAAWLVTCDATAVHSIA